MDRSVEFYCGILGMKVMCAKGPSEEAWSSGQPVSGADASWRFRRFYWLEMYNGDVLALLEFPDRDTTAPPTYFGSLWPGNRPSNKKPAGVDHIAFNVNSLDELKAMRERLLSNKVECSEIFQATAPTAVYSVWFYDPDGNACEVATWDFGNPEWNTREVDWYADPVLPKSFAKNFDLWRVPEPRRHSVNAAS
jgi:catechol 2,3-dioxygenase-like lactoylglutathione lyase family enzyme